jgi:hypothetical protein
LNPAPEVRRMASLLTVTAIIIGKISSLLDLNTVINLPAITYGQ